MTFAPLQTSMREGDPVAGAEVQRRRPCSPRSMYSLATAVGSSYRYIVLCVDTWKLGIHDIKEDALRDIQSKLSITNIAQELFTSFAARWVSTSFFSFVSSHLDLFSHKVVMDTEIQFLHDNFTEKDSKLLMDHIQRMAAGKAPFFATTLSLVYDKLIEKAFAQPVPSGSDFGQSAEVESVADSCPRLQPSISATGAPSISTSSNAPPVPSFVPQTPTPVPGPGLVPSSVPTRLAWLRCHRCLRSVKLEDLYDGLRCPQCPPKDIKGPPLMQCTLCSTIRTARKDNCLKIMCGARFM